MRYWIITPPHILTHTHPIGFLSTKLINPETNPELRVRKVRAAREMAMRFAQEERGRGLPS